MRRCPSAHRGSHVERAAASFSIPVVRELPRPPELVVVASVW
jgi:hypothetical protein